MITVSELNGEFSPRTENLLYVAQIKNISWIRFYERNFLFHRFSIQSEGSFSTDGNTYTLMAEFAGLPQKYKPVATITGASDEEILKVFRIFEGS